MSKLEREIIAILREHGFTLKRDGFETFVWIDFDLPVTFNITTFAKELAKRIALKETTS